jgi:hypothetical protein
VRQHRLLQVGGGVEGIAGCQPLLRSANDLARGNADAPLEFVPGLTHLDRRPASAQGVVLVRVRNPEHVITASPMNFSVPPWRSAIGFHPLEVAGQQRRNASGSVDSCLQVLRRAYAGIDQCLSRTEGG